MELIKQKKLHFFVIASVIAHAIAAISVGSLFENQNRLFISAVDSYKPLMVSMHSGNLTHRDKNRGKKSANLTKKPTVSSEHNATKSKIDSAVQIPDAQNLVDQSKHSTAPDKNNTISHDIQLANAPVDLASESHIESTSYKHKNNDSMDVKTLEQKNAVIHKRLNALVESNFQYPRFAIKRGWEGTVELGLRIEANGRLSNVHVVKTSGYSILDEAALSTLSQANFINGLDAWLAGNYFDTTLPVKYKLVGG